MGAEEFDEIGPIDHLLVELPGPNRPARPRRTWSTSSPRPDPHPRPLLPQSRPRTAPSPWLISPTSAARSAAGRLRGRLPRASSSTTTSGGRRALEPGTAARRRSTRTAGRGRSPALSAAPGASSSPVGRIPVQPVLAAPKRPTRQRTKWPGPVYRRRRPDRRIAGTATSVSNALPGARAGAGPAGLPSPPRKRPRRPPPAPRRRNSMLDQLKQLGELKSQGILTEEEFAAQKAKLLG